MRSQLPAVVLLSSVLLTDAGARAEDDKSVYVGEHGSDDAAAVTSSGFDWRVDVGANLAFNDNRGVVGQTDGSTLTFGYRTAGELGWRGGDHELRTGLSFAAALSRTPAVDELIKTRDEAALDAIYLYHVVDWFGPFIKLAANTAAFAGADVRSAPTDYRILHVDGSTELPTLRRLPLTDPFHPTRFKESLGAFLRPLTAEAMNLEVRAGGGARETIAAGQLAIDDDKDTADLIEVSELRDVQQVGVEEVLELWGALSEKKVSYKLGAEVLTPVAHSDLAPGDTRSNGELTDVAFHAALSFKVVDWATLDYELSASREPQLIDVWQVRNNLLLNLGVTAGSGASRKNK